MTKEEIFSKMPFVETERLILREITVDDATDMYEGAKEPDVSKYIFWYPHKDMDETNAVIGFFKDAFVNKESIELGIILKETNKLIGVIGYNTFNHENKACEVGYWIAKDYWGKGYTSEALGAIIDYGFRVFDLERIWAKHATQNPGSGKVMIKSGMTFEGILRHGAFYKDRFWDVSVHSILKGEYNK